MPCAPYTRPGPLQDLPLEHFTSSPCNVSKTPQARPAKRQLTSPLPMNAAKRRMLMLEGAVSPKEVIALGSTSTPSPAPRVSRRKITFGSSLYPVAEGTESCDVDMLFVENCNSPNMSPRKHTKLAPALPIHPSTSQPSSSGSLWITSTAPQDRTVASHKSLAKTDPSSVHYPGFDIHMDTHPSFSHASNTRFLPPADFEEAELSKENVPPRRKGAKLSPSAHRGFSHHLPSPSLSLRPAFAGFHGSPPRFNPSNSGPFDHFAALAHLSPAFEDPVKAATPFGPTPLWTLEPPYHV